MPFQTITEAEQHRFATSVARCDLAYVSHPFSSQDELETRYLNAHDLRGIIVDAEFLATLDHESRTNFFNSMRSNGYTLLINCIEDMGAYRELVGLLTSWTPHYNGWGRLNGLPLVVVFGPGEYFYNETKNSHPMFSDPSPEVLALWKAIALGDIEYVLAHQTQLDAVDTGTARILYHTAYHLGHRLLIQLLHPKSHAPGERSSLFSSSLRHEKRPSNIQFSSTGESIPPYVQRSSELKYSKTAIAPQCFVSPVMILI